MGALKKYVHTQVPAEFTEVFSGYDRLTQSLLYARGITTKEKAERFLNPQYDTDLHDPFLLTDMRKAVDRVLAAMRNNEHIVVYTDYDCDGIPGGVLLHDFFTAIGYNNFENYIPHRHYEGYGFNSESVKGFEKSDTKLIITVDCGITDHEAVQKANEANIDVIITDHHEPSDTLPAAVAVINPKRDTEYPFSGICGTVVAYKLVQAILETGKKSGEITLKDGWEKWWLDLVGIATVADMVPLTDENRVFAKYGLSVLRKSKRPGLQQLLRKAGGSQQHLTEDDIGFTIAPRVNAASRMDDPEDAFHMLRSRDEIESGAHVLHLEKLNNERKGVVASMTKEARKRMSTSSEIPAIIVMGSPEWRPSLVGLVASTLAEEFGRPAFLWGRDGKGIIKGSCRSGDVGSVVRLMEEGKKAFLTFGGHHASGGFSVSHESIHTLAETLNAAKEALNTKEVAVSEDVRIDMQITFSDITNDLLRALDVLGPFGIGNPKPLFEIRDVIPDEVITFGKTQNHTKLRFKTDRGRFDAICFFKLPNEFSILPEEGKKLTLLAHIERSFFMGRLETRLRIIDVC
ncbi:MAG: single-stranded-DNA-specific exonuclease RecJ [Candidatus Pacebacteria bacterium]|nr:single-stranded-DNA-specific exonuclease RecJ [Candidatus Paceibacterota bacterium]MCF7857458.1 single-stranded-DNA-specific exonuclease RecJ [Candidatus Paceibacterota bacterium]